MFNMMLVYSRYSSKNENIVDYNRDGGAQQQSGHVDVLDETDPVGSHHK